MPELAIRVAGVQKSFKLYQRRETTLKEVVLRRRRGVYESFRALDDVSFDVEQGQVLGIIGRNGSGKSTLLKLLARILVPDAGTVETVGRVSALLEVGAGFHPDYSAIENIFLSGAIYGVPRQELARKVDEIIGFAELERFADNPVKTYSSGMYARLGFSIAVNVDPDILLIDEVLAVGDQSFQARCLDRMLEFRDAGKTLVLVTHDAGAVESFCDRAIWIDGGRIREDALPHHVVRAYVADVNAGDERWSIERTRARGPMVGDHVPAVAHHPVHLTAMAFLDSDGQEREVFHNGEGMRARIYYDAISEQPSPWCEIRVDRHDGVHVTTASTRLAGFEVETMPAGQGYFEWSVDDLRLTPGTYYFTPRILEQTGVSAYDEHDRWYRIRIHAGSYRERHGVAIMPSSWSYSAVDSAGVGGAPPSARSGLRGGSGLVSPAHRDADTAPPSAGGLSPTT